MKNGLFKMVSTTTLAGLMFVGCGGGSSSGSSSSTPTAPTTLTGTFIDAQVKGLHYKTATQEGDTNEAGEFKYLAGETIEFKLGNLSLGSVNADGLITPYTLAGDTDISNPSDKAVNIALLLQNFDADRTDGILDVLKLKDMDLSTFSLSDTPATNEGKISTKFADNNFVTTSGVLTPTLIDAQTAKTNLKNNVALSAIKYNKKFTQAYLDQVTLYQVQDGIIKTHQYRNGVWLFDDTGSALVPPIKHEGTYTIDANGELAIIDTDGNFNVTISTVTADYIETTTSGAITQTVKLYTDKSKAQAELTGSTISFVSGKTIVMNDQNSAGYMTLVFDANGNYEERGFEAQKDSNNQDVPYTCYGKWKDLGNNKIAGTCDEGANYIRPEVTGDVMGDNGEIHFTFADKTLSVSSNVTVDFKNDDGLKEQRTITVKSVSAISDSSTITVESGFTAEYLNGKTFYVVSQWDSWVTYKNIFNNGTISYVDSPEDGTSTYTVENGKIKVAASGTSSAYEVNVVEVTSEYIKVSDTDSPNSYEYFYFEKAKADAKLAELTGSASSSISVSSGFTQAYLDQVTLYEVKKDNGIVISHQFRNGKWLFDDTGSTLVNPTKQEGTYTIDANGALVITDQIDPSVFTGTISTVTADYIEITTSGAITGTVKFYTDKSKAQTYLNSL